jgi:hypothetical protein
MNRTDDLAVGQFENIVEKNPTAEPWALLSGEPAKMRGY